MQNEIQQSKLLCVEGKDEINFFHELLNHLEIYEVEIKEVGGKTNFKNELPTLTASSGFSDVEILAIIRDADDNPEGAFHSVKNILKKDPNLSVTLPENINEFTSGHPSIGIFIMPGDFDKGMLENLCLKTVQNHPAMKCVKIFSECISELDDPPKNMAKAKAQAFLAAMPKIAKDVGIGSKKGYWDFDSPELNPLKSFLDKLR